MKFKATLESNGKRTGPTEETIVDRAYLRRVDFERDYPTSLPFEKRMLAEWFKARFAKAN